MPHLLCRSADREIEVANWPACCSRYKALFDFFRRADDPAQLDGPCIEHLALLRYPCLRL